MPIDAGNTTPDSVLTGFYLLINESVFNNQLPQLPVLWITDRDYLGATRLYEKMPVDICLNADKVIEQWKQRIEYENAETDEELKEQLLEVILPTLLHEMIHVYCHVNNLDGFNQETKEHPKAFIDAAFKHGLIYDDFLDFNMLGYTALEFLDMINKGGID